MTLRKENLYLIYRYILNLLTQINYKLMLYQVCSEDKKKENSMFKYSSCSLSLTIIPHMKCYCTCNLEIKQVFRQNINCIYYPKFSQRKESKKKGVKKLKIHHLTKKIILER